MINANSTLYLAGNHKKIGYDCPLSLAPITCPMGPALLINSTGDLSMRQSNRPIWWAFTWYLFQGRVPVPKNALCQQHLSATDEH